MNELKERLEECFALVFPNLDRRRIPSASVSSLPEWDSLATMTLIALIEEQFNMEIPAEDLGELLSFELILDYLQSKRHASAA